MSGPLVTTVCGTDAAFASLRHEWNHLLARSASNSVFLTWEWLHAWWRQFADTSQLRIYCIREPGGRLVGLAPLCVTASASWPFKNILTFLGTVRVSSDYLDLVAERGFEDAVIDAVAAAIQDDRDRYDLVVLSDVLSSGLVSRLAERFERSPNLIVDRSPAHVCPYLELPATEDAFLGQLGARTRESLRRRTRQLSRLGAEVVLVRTAGELEEALKALFDLHGKRWTARGLPGNFEDPRVRRFHREVAPGFLENGWLRFHTVRLNGAIVAVLYGFAYDGRYSYYQAGFDPAWSQASPGAVLMHRAICDAIAEGLGEFDFLRGDEGYKARWTEARRRTWVVRAVPRERWWAVARYRGARAFEAVKRIVRPYVVAPPREATARGGARQPLRDDDTVGRQDPTMHPESRVAVRGRPKAAPAPAARVRRIVIFTANPAYSVRKGIVELSDAFPDIHWLIVERSGSPSFKTFVRNQRNNLKKHGWRWIPHATWEAMTAAGDRAGRTKAESRVGPGRQYDWRSILRRRNVRHLLVSDIHAESVLEAVRSFGADVGISLAAPILKPALYSLPKEGTLNLHKGRLPEFRGMPPAFWEFYTDQREFGCCVHRVEEKLDRGPILLRRVLPRPEFATLVGTQLTLDEVGVTLMREAIGLLRAGPARWETQPPGGKTYRKPTLRQERDLARRLAPRPEGPVLRRIAKDAFFRTYSHAIRPIPRAVRGMLGRQRVVVLLYHRVNDDLRDNLTVGIEQFNRQMEHIRRNYSVVDVNDLVSGDYSRSVSRPVVVVTFDDGYLDNWDNAVPILLRHHVPASFFVSTGMIGTERPFEYDLSRLGRALPTMTWDHLRRMRSLGFTVGSHTVTHIDCGKADDATVRAELTESRDTIRRELGIRDMIFAYPFGGRHNIRPSVLGMVRELGYTACLSAYGGCENGQIDPYNIRRMGIDCRFSFAAFDARLQGFGGVR